MSVSVITGPHGPASSALISWLKGIFGNAFSVSRGYSSEHDGIDLPAKEGTPIRALSSGIVSYARDARIQADHGLSHWAAGGGNVVNIDIGNSLTTQYAHLQKIFVKEGQTVKAGDIIGTVGKTGGVTSSGAFGGAGAEFVGAHLHFGLWDHTVNKMINPQKFLENIGDTSSGSSGLTLASWQDKLKSIGLSTDPSHIFTHDEAIAIVSQLYKIDPSSSMGKSITASFEGKSVVDSMKGSGGLDLNPLDSVGSALGAVGKQLSDTFTWIGFIILGLVFIGGGIYLLKPTSGEG